MADWGPNHGRGRVGTWDAAARRARTLVWAGPFDFGRATAKRLRNWAIADTWPGRLLPWLPVAFASASRSISPPIASPPGGQAPAWRLSEPQSGGDGASASSTIPFGFDGMFWRLMGH